MKTNNEKRTLYIRYAGPVLPEMPPLNKGSVVDGDEREAFNPTGLLPQNTGMIEEHPECALEGKSCKPTRSGFRANAKAVSQVKA